MERVRQFERPTTNTGKLTKRSVERMAIPAKAPTFL